MGHHEAHISIPYLAIVQRRRPEIRIYCSLTIECSHIDLPSKHSRERFLFSDARHASPNLQLFCSIARTTSGGSALLLRPRISVVHQPFQRARFEKRRSVLQIEGPISGPALLQGPVLDTGKPGPCAPHTLVIGLDPPMDAARSRLQAAPDTARGPHQLCQSSNLRARLDVTRSPHGEPLAGRQILEYEKCPANKKQMNRGCYCLICKPIGTKCCHRRISSPEVPRPQSFVLS